MPFTVKESPKCPACKRSVFMAETVMAADRKPYHRICVKCVSCNIMLNPRTLNEHQEKLFCNVCYERVFQPQEYSVDMYGGIVTPEDIARREEEARKEKERLERAVTGKCCPTCAKKVFPEKSIIVQDVVFHNTCLACSECMRSMPGPDMCLDPKKDNKPYCKFCYAKIYGQSAIPIAEMVQIAPEQYAIQGL